MEGSQKDDGVPKINPDWEKALDAVMYTSLMSKSMAPQSSSTDDEEDPDSGDRPKTGLGGSATAVPISNPKIGDPPAGLARKHNADLSDSLSDSETVSDEDDEDDEDDDDYASTDEEDDRPPARFKGGMPPPPFRPGSGPGSASAPRGGPGPMAMMPPPPRGMPMAPPRGMPPGPPGAAGVPMAPPRPRPPPPASTSFEKSAQPVLDPNAEAMKRRLDENRNLQREEKYELLGRLQYFVDEKGFKPFRVLGPEDTLEDIRYEVFRAQREMNKKRNVKMMQKALVTVGAGIEMMNSWYNPLKMRLDGFSKSLLLSIREYDEIFEELHWKYSDAVSMPPEMKLVMTLGSSLWFFHMSNHSSIPSSTPGDSSRPSPTSTASVPPTPTQPPPSASAPAQRRMNGPRSSSQSSGTGIGAPDFSVFPPAALRSVGSVGGGMQPGMGAAMDMTSLLSGLGMVQTLMSGGSGF